MHSGTILNHSSRIAFKGENRRNYFIMKTTFLFLYIFFFLTMSELTAQSIFSGMVTKIIDGDSVVVKKGRKYIEVRMYGIDCPEWNQYYSIEAREYTATLLHNQQITLIPQYHDKYGRLVALLVKNGQDVNGELVRSGTAWVYPRFCHKEVCKTWLANQEIAKSEGRGLWQRTVQ